MDKPKRFDGHRVFFWSAVGVSVVWIALLSQSKDRKLLTIFEAEGRRQIENYARYNYPDFAENMGWDGR